MDKFVKNIREKNNKRRKKFKQQQTKKALKIIAITLLAVIIVCSAYLMGRSSTRSQIVSAILDYTDNHTGTPSQDVQLENNTNTDIVTNSEPTDKIATISVVGDIMCSKEQYEDAYNAETEEYDFKYLFDKVKNYLRLSDLTIGNLETTFSGKDVGYSGIPKFNTPSELGTALKNVGFDMLTTANEHSMDRGFEGAKSTLDFLDSMGMSHTGTSRTEDESNRIIIKNVKDINIAFLAYTYGTNVTTDKTFSINLINKDKMLADINKAKEQKADIICVNMHWGKEFGQSFNQEQKDLENFLFENGADIILGTHPHILQKMEKKKITTKEGLEKEVFVAYSLGNFISNQTNKYTNISTILNLEFIKKVGEDKVNINKISYRPIYMLKDAKEINGKKYLILDIADAIKDYEEGKEEAVNKTIYNDLKKSLEDIYKLTGTKEVL